MSQSHFLADSGDNYAFVVSPPVAANPPQAVTTAVSLIDNEQSVSLIDKSKAQTASLLDNLNPFSGCEDCRKKKMMIVGGLAIAYFGYKAYWGK